MGTIPAHLSPSPEQRAYLARRASALDAWLSPAGPERVRVEIAAMLEVMGVKGGEEVDRRARLEIYASDLAGVPQAALSAACRDYRAGVVGDGKWMPTPGEIRKRAMWLADSAYTERGKINSVLEAKIDNRRPVDDAKRQAALAHAKETAAMLRMARPINEKRHAADDLEAPEAPLTEAQMQARAQAWLDAEAAKEPPRIMLSDTASKSLGLTGEAA